MASVMVTGRMSDDKKAAGLRVLKRNALNASQAINMLFDRLIADGDISFLRDEPQSCQSNFALAAKYVDSISEPRKTQFDNMNKREIKMHRLAAKEARLS